MDAATLDQLLRQAIAHHQSGRLGEAERLYRQILTHQPNHPDATHYLGVIAVEVGQFDVGVPLIETAARLQSNNPEVFGNLGYALRRQNRLDDAVAALNKALALNPRYAEACFNLGLTLFDQGKFSEATATYRRAIEIRPGFAEAHSELGNALCRTGRGEEAFASYRQAVMLDLRSPQPYCNLANALTEIGQFDHAIAACRHAIKLQSDHAPAYAHLGSALRGKRFLEEAIAAHRRAIALNPNMGHLHSNLANALKDCGRLDEAIASYREAMQYPLGRAAAHSNLVLAMQYHPDYDAGAIHDELKRWTDANTAPLQKPLQPFANNQDPDRRLRVGYVSGDFCEHVVGRNILPLLREHDHRQFEIFCYSNNARADWMTERFQKCADTWRNIAHLSDADAESLIRDDQIDILVDLALHTSGNRLAIFAQKPAPIQVAFAGYPGSTGLRTIDHRLTDPYLDPPGSDTSVYSESSFRLPSTFWCYDESEADLTPGELPAQSNGFITFGCLNNLCKVNGSVLRLWARVLAEVPQSRLMVLSPDDGGDKSMLELFGKEGIDPNRIDITHRASHRQYLEQYHKIDIGLDTFPYNGHTTSLDALWMGVPVVTLVGKTVVGRAGLSQLANLGLTELAAETPTNTSPSPRNWPATSRVYPTCAKPSVRACNHPPSWMHEASQQVSRPHTGTCGGNGAEVRARS
jgi:predicted O-linked N-acetylglucosamine transferase (SPINDLY family)